MIVGHLGLAYAASAKTGNAPFVLFVLASVAPDGVDVVLSLLEVCSPYGRYSHSLPVLVALALLVGAAGWLLTRNRVFGLIAMALVLSHLPLDWVTGRKALLLNGPLVGADIYRWPVTDFLTEIPLLLAGWWVARQAQITPRWAVTVGAVLILTFIQGIGNSMQYFNLEKPKSSQNAACRATWRS